MQQDHRSSLWFSFDIIKVQERIFNRKGNAEMKRKYVFIVLMIFILFLGGCGKKEDLSEVIAGKTYYNTVDEYGNEKHSKVWLGKDGSFIFNDNFSEGTYSITGTWKVKENVLTLDVEKSQVGDYSDILMEIQDADTLVLRSTLAGSRSEQIFSTTEVTGSDVVPVTTEEITFEIYYDVNQTFTKKPNMILYSDQTFTFEDCSDLSSAEVKGKYIYEDGQLILKDLAPAETFAVTEIRFYIYDEGIFILDTEGLGIAQRGDYFTLDGKDDILSQIPMADNLGNEGSKWGNTSKIDWVNPEYLPKVVFETSGKFIFTENVYAGMVEITGWYEKKDDGYICHVDDNSQLKGFAGEGIELIEFKKTGDSSMELKSDICMSMSGDIFDIQQ